VEVTDAIAHYGQNVLVYKPKSSSHPHLENNFLPLDKMSSGSNDVAPFCPAFYGADGQTDLARAAF